MSGTIAVVAGDTGRFTAFTSSLSRLQKPTGTEVSVIVGSDRIKGRNLQVEEMVGDWLWFIDDDHEFAPNTLMRLLEHQVDVVVPLCLMRSKPFNPVDFVDEDEDGLLPIDLKTAPASGTAELYAAGTSGMLIRRNVFDLFRERWPGAPIFEHEADRSEDLIFSERLRELGVKIHLDLSTRLGHINVVTIYPDHAGGEWAIGMRVGQNFPLRIAIEGGQ